MEVRCSSCHRAFNIDDSRAKKYPSVRCVCGERLPLSPKFAHHRRLGNYVIERKIASGGMGEIYFGKLGGIEGFEREVAIKKMLPHLSADPDFINMMIKEAKLTVLLHHPNIVQIYDLSKDGNEYYIAMEYVPGSTVGKIIQRTVQRNEKLPVPICVHITMQVLRGLAYAHELCDPAGNPIHLLHRDITPQNILVTSEGWVKITDFGIAKARNEISTTSPGMIKGKIGYIAPEQLAGKPAEQGVDIFCAGILLWEMLAGKRLFKGPTEADTFRMISECNIPAMSTLRDDVPEGIEKVMRKALAANPQERYPSADAYLRDLNTAIFPETADDVFRYTKQYFAKYPDMFAPDEAPEDSKEAAIPDTTPIDKIPSVKKILVSKQKSDHSLVAALSIALVVLIAASVAVGLYATQKKPVEISKTPIAPSPTEAPELPKPNNEVSQDEIQLAVNAERPSIIKCYARSNHIFRTIHKLDVALVVASTGKIAQTTYMPSIAKFGQVEACLADVFAGMQIRAHNLPRFETTVSLPAPDKEAPVPPPQPTPVKQPPKPLTGAEIQQSLQRQAGSIQACVQRADAASVALPSANTKLTINTAGAVTDVTFDPPLTPGPFQQCLLKSLHGIHFRPQPVDNFSFTFPLTFQRL